MKNIKLIEVPSEIGAGTRGASLGVDAIKIAALDFMSNFFIHFPSEKVETENTLLFEPIYSPYAKRIQGVLNMYERISKAVCDSMKNNFFPVILSGDHSNAGGTIAGIKMAKPKSKLGVIWIDAHADLRIAYEGFTYSHASIMYNVLSTIPQVNKLVQVGIRDYCDEELEMINTSNGRIKTYFDRDIKARQYEGETWKAICNDIIASLPQKVYISFDIDGLDPKLCPNTGTPVPGGFEAEQIFYLFRLLHESGKQLIGFDLNEVSSGSHTGDGIDAITGARVLFKLCNFMVA
jgi:agmatinase